LDTEIELSESPDVTPLDFGVWGWMKSEMYKRQVDTRDELLARIVDTAACITKRKDQLRRKRTTRDLRTRFAECAELGYEGFERLL
jgi:hypothetical protein